MRQPCNIILSLVFTTAAPGAAWLYQQFNDAWFYIIGIQEGRAPSDAESRSAHFVQFVGGATQTSTLGCQTWLHKRLRPKTTAVVHHSPRLSEVRFVSAVMPGEWAVDAARAPHSGHVLSVRNAFWDDLGAALRRIHDDGLGDRLALLLDANARVWASFAGMLAHWRG